MAPEGGAKRPHLLFLAFFFPPSRASGVYRALAIARAFDDAGWKVTVVTTTRRFLLGEIGSIDESLLAEIPPGVDVIRLPFSFWRPPVSGDIRAIGWLWGNYPSLRRYVRLIRVRLVDILRRLAGRLPLPQVTENYSEWITPALDAALRVHAESPIDHVLATGNPYSSFEAARLISMRTGAPFSIDFRDPWTFDLYTGRPKTLDAATLAAERQIVESASACFHVNAAIAGAYSKRYPTTAAKHHVVPNGFDMSSIGRVHDLHGEGALTLGMIGTITDRWPLEPVLAAWALTRPHLPSGSRLLLAGHLGYFDNRSAQLRDTISEHRPGFEYVGPVSKGEVGKFYEQLDVVVVPVPEGEMVTSGKIYEALGLGIPLVCIQPAGGGARALLDHHPAAFGAEPRSSEIGDALLAAARLAATMTADDVGKIRRSMMVFERSTSIRPMVDTVAASLVLSAV